MQVVMSHHNNYVAALLDSICASLNKAGLYERAGDLYDHLNRQQEAIQSYRKGHAYRWVEGGGWCQKQLALPILSLTSVCLMSLLPLCRRVDRHLPAYILYCACHVEHSTQSQADTEPPAKLFTAHQRFCYTPRCIVSNEVISLPA